MVKLLLERDRDLIEGIWNTCSNVLDEWGINESEESLETLMPKAKVVEQARAASEAEIRDLEVLDSEAIHFLVISPARMVARVDENAWIAKKSIKEVASLNIQSRLQAQLTKGPEAEELMELNGKWANWDKSVGKASGL